jgi:nifR3 family TIM-barrel protein
MAGYTKAPFRAICRRYHCGLVFTEVVSSKDIARGLNQGTRFLEVFPEEQPIGAHIYGADVDIMTRAVEVIESLDRFALVDINCGCPVPKVMKRGSGAALMQDPEHIHSIVRAVCTTTSLPVTVKTRLGLSPETPNVSEVAQAAEEGGASAVVVHARFASDRHKGPADWGALKRIKAERTVPVVGNGGVTEARHALEMMAQTGVDGVMVARAAIGNPWVFDEIHHLWTGAPYTPPSAQERRAIIEEHLRRLCEAISIENRGHLPSYITAEQIACRQFRRHVVKYLAGIRGLGELRKNLSEMDSVPEIMAAVDRVLELD